MSQEKLARKLHISTKFLNVTSLRQIYMLIHLKACVQVDLGEEVPTCKFLNLYIFLIFFFHSEQFADIVKIVSVIFTPKLLKKSSYVLHLKCLNWQITFF